MENIGQHDDPFASKRTLTIFVAAISSLGDTTSASVVEGFRWCLEGAHRIRDVIVTWSHTLPAGIGWLVPVALVMTGAIVGQFFARITPRASGSGIQDVEAVWHGEHGLPGPGVIPARFIGGVISIGSGLVLGREVERSPGFGARIRGWAPLSPVGL